MATERLAATDRRWLDAAFALAARQAGRADPNPDVACLLIAPDGRVLGRGVTALGGRPHAEALALLQAGAAARGATAYVTLEPCAHTGGRGPPCSAGLIAAGVARVVVGALDPDPRTAGAGLAALRAAGVSFSLAPEPTAPPGLAGHISRHTLGRPHVTLKLATSLDGAIALPSGESRWITGPVARAMVHRLRAEVQAVIVGAGTLVADAPALDVRLPGHAGPQPAKVVLSRDAGLALPPDWTRLSSPAAIADLPAHAVLVEGGAGAAAAFLRADLVDRLIWFHAPIILGKGRRAVDDLGLTGLGAAHGRWRQVDVRQLGGDRMLTYVRDRAVA